MQVLGEHSQHGTSASTDSDAPNTSLAGEVVTSTIKRGRRRGARARVRARRFTTGPKRARRAGWNHETLNLPDPLLTVQMALADLSPADFPSTDFSPADFSPAAPGSLAIARPTP